MKLSVKFLLPIILILLVIQVGLIYIYLNLKPNLNLPIHYSFYSTKEFYNEAYQVGDKEAIEPESRIFGAITPHHLFVKDKVAALFDGLQDYDYQTVILIGPDHGNRGKNNISLSRALWQTPYGQIQPDLKIIDGLTEKYGQQIDEYPFIYEFSISGLVPFIKKYFPHAKIVTLSIKKSTAPIEAEKLANELRALVNPEKTLLLASVDFSHGLVADLADQHDEVSAKTIANFDLAKIYSLDLDSPPAIYVLLKYLEEIGANKSKLIFHTNSSRLLNKPELPSTSHLFYYFSK